MSENSIKRFAFEKLPEFTLNKTLQILETNYGISGTLNPLWGERDLNFMVNVDGKEEFILKISNSLESNINIEFQIAALHHLALHAPILSVPKIIPLIDGRLFGKTIGFNNKKHFFHLMSRIHGEEFELTAFNHKGLKAVGHQAGIATLGLRGFFHPGAVRQMFWDVRHLHNYIEHIPYIKDLSLRKFIETFVPRFHNEIVPILSSVRAQIIHHDTNPSNVLVDPNDQDCVTGLIDFGDMIHGSIAQEVAVAAAEMSSDANDTLNHMVSVVQGFDSAFPLEEVEIELQYDLIVARKVLGILIGIVRDLGGICSSDEKDYLDIYAPSLDSLLKIGPETLRKAIRSVCRFSEYCPPRPLPSGTNKHLTDSIISRRVKVLGEKLQLSYDTAVHTVRGEGVWLYDIDGNRYLDCYNNVPHVGHCHPHVARSVFRQISTLNTNTRYLFESVVEYAEQLGKMMPSDLSACLFVNSGSEANDLALRMARICTGQHGTLIIDGAYHGITNEIYALSPSNDWWVNDEPNFSHASVSRIDIETIINPDTIRGPFQLDDPEAGEKYAADAERAIKSLSHSGYPVGAFMVDTSFATHGILNVPEGYLSGVVGRVRSAGGMIIADEVQYGFGRSGNHMWGFENYGIIPDFVTLGKPIGNGIALGVVVTTPAILEKFTRITEFFSTFGGNPVACAAGLAVIDVIDEENLIENCLKTGQYLRDGLRLVSKDAANIGDVRGKGLFIGVDVVSDRNFMSPDAQERSRIQNHLRDNGFLVGSEGIHGNLLKIRPPMVFQKKHADMLIDAFANAITL